MRKKVRRAFWFTARKYEENSVSNCGMKQGKGWEGKRAAF
jgi:hypothetical protein